MCRGTLAAIPPFLLSLKAVFVVRSMFDRRLLGCLSRAAKVGRSDAPNLLYQVYTNVSPPFISSSFHLPAFL